MKKLFLLLLPFLFAEAYGQEFKPIYDRIGITTCFFSYGNKYNKALQQAIDSFPTPVQTFNNNLNNGVINISRKYEDEAGYLNEAKDNRRIKACMEYFSENNFDNRIVGKWYNYQPDQGFDLSLIYQRAEYNATREQYMIAHASKRGEAVIRDYGHNLVDRSYILVIDLRNVKKEKKYQGTQITYQGDMNFYIFKLQFGEDEIDSFFDTWVYQTDSPETRARKLERFEAIDFPIKFIHKKSTGFYVSKATDTNLKNKKDPLHEFIKECYRMAISKAGKKVDDFRVKSKIVETKPVQARIGTKDAVAIDRKYLVYEYKWDDKQNEAVPERKGAVRAKKISKGKNKKSSFYQISGGKIQSGMFLAEKRDRGISIAAGYENQGLGGYNIRLKGRMRKYIKIPGLYLILEMGYSPQSYSQQDIHASTYLSNFDKPDLMFSRWDAGLGKGFHFANILEITPFITFGKNWIRASDTQDRNYSTYLYKTGLSLGASVLHNIQLFGQLNYYGLFEVIVKDTEGDEIGDMGGENWSDEFPGQEGGIGIQYGIRYEF